MVRVIFGNNEFQCYKVLSEIIEDYLTKASKNSIERFDASELSSVDEVYESLSSVSLFDAEKLTILRNLSANKVLAEDFQKLFKKIDKFTKLVIFDPKLDKRTKMYKFLKDNFQVIECQKLSIEELVDWVVNEFKKNEKKIDRQLAYKLVQMCGDDQILLMNEIIKLTNNSEESEKIDSELVSQLVEAIPSSKIFDMLEALFSGNTKNAWKFYIDQRSQGVEIIQINSMIVWQLKQLFMAKYVPNGSKKTLIEAGISPFVADKSIDLAKKISISNLKNCLETLVQADFRSRTDSNPDSAMEYCIAQISSFVKT